MAQDNLESKKQANLLFTRKSISAYNKKDFVLYFKKKYEETNDLAYYEVNVPASYGVLGVVTDNFYKAGYGKEEVIKFMDYALQKGKVEHRNVKLRTLHYELSDYLFNLKNGI